MLSLLQLTWQSAFYRAPKTILVTGPRGAGKTLLVRLLHQGVTTGDLDSHAVATTLPASGAQYGLSATLVNYRRHKLRLWDVHGQAFTDVSEEYVTQADAIIYVIDVATSTLQSDISALTMQYAAGLQGRALLLLNKCDTVTPQQGRQVLEAVNECVKDLVPVVRIMVGSLLDTSVESVYRILDAALASSRQPFIEPF